MNNVIPLVGRNEAEVNKPLSELVGIGVHEVRDVTLACVVL